MKKLFTLVAAIATSVAICAEVQSADKNFKGNACEVLLSKAAAAKPVAVYFNGLVPNSGTYTLKSVHTFANGAVVTNTIQAATAITTNIVNAAQYVLRGDSLRIEFSAATNGAVCVVTQIEK